MDVVELLMHAGAQVRERAGMLEVLVEGPDVVVRWSSMSGTHSITDRVPLEDLRTQAGQDRLTSYLKPPASISARG